MNENNSHCYLCVIDLISKKLYIYTGLFAKHNWARNSNKRRENGGIVSFSFYSIMIFLFDFVKFLY